MALQSARVASASQIWLLFALAESVPGVQGISDELISAY
jgi:hypothetical protein